MVGSSIAPRLRESTRTRSAQSQTEATPGSSTSSTSAPSGRMTRLRAKESGVGVPAGTVAQPALTRTNTTGSAGLFSKSKEGFRKVSDKIKEKEKEAAAKAKGNVRASVAPAPQHTGYTESLQAFLRIRPADAEGPANPYLEIKNDKAVVMTAPADGGARHHIPKPPHTYSFDRVFSPETQQQDFFEVTTLPLVDKLLKGDNGLMFAYGVSNSGKTYTIQGGNQTVLEERGVLPRSIDVVFNSIAGLESKANLKCQGLADVVLTDEPDTPLCSLASEPEARITDTCKVDRNFSYAVFVSYAEVYNEKVFDLLESVLPSARPTLSYMPRTMSMGVGLSSGIGSSMSLAAMANGGAGVLKRRALVLKNDPEGSGKYISGLNEIRVRTREEALAVFRSGQRARQVFGTMANRESSRSHGIFTIKVVRIHNGAPEDPESAQVSRLAIVDLAGSERTRNTATTGDRLKEAGNINKSLMVLGQCIEVLRANQQKMSAPSSLGLKRRLAVVPFRHSKLTEIFQSFFVGDGRAVMIVHVNPYDTGFDENSNVMKFSAIAQEISTVQTPRAFPALKKQLSSQFSALRNAVTGHVGGQKIKVMVPVMPKAVVTPVNVGSATTSSFSRPTAASANRTSTAGRATGTGIPTRISTTGRVSRPPTRPASPQETESAPSIDGITIVEEEIEVVEEEPEEEEDDEHDYLVDYLFEQLRQLKTQLYESEMRNAEAEMRIREEVSQEAQETIQKIQAHYNQRLEQLTARGEEKADMKLDILQRTIAADDETSFEQSFMTEDGDESLSSATVDADLSVLSNPFEIAAPRFTASTQDASFATAMSDDVDTSMEAEESDGEDTDDAVDESRIESASRVEPVREREHTGEISTDADESRLAGSDEEDEVGSEEEEGSELDDDEEEGSADEEDEEDEEDSLDVSDSDEDSTFEEEDASVSTVSTPPRNRRKSASPAKKGAVPAPKASTPAKAPTAKKAPAKKALRDSNVQPMNLISDEEDMVVKKDPPVKKKRTLGKKIITEDEIEAAAEQQARAGGPEVRRMVRGL